MFGNGKGFTPLVSTKQTKEQYTDSNGNSWSVFDHPFSDNSGKITQQGSAFPDDGKGGGITGTCGLCATGTIINKAGGSATEKSVAIHAIQRGLCSNEANKKPENRGGTNPRQRVQILKDAGIPSTCVAGASLESISSEVEKGKGVMISVTASIYKPEWYGTYSEANRGGHAIVLESPIRDPKTGRITGYVVTDSNGSTSKEATVIVPADVLETAFGHRGGQAIITDDVIW